METKRNLLVFVSVALLVTWLAAWLAPRAEEERERIEVKPVLLVVDVQNIWMPLMAEEDRMSAPERINESIAMFREFGYPVIRVYHTDPKRGPEPDTQPFEFPDSIAVTKDDPKVIKNHSSAFVKTDLDEILREGGHNAVFLCGLSATGCVLATYFGASEREYMAFMVEGALLSGNASHTKTIEDICYSVSPEELRDLLEDPFL